MKFEDLVSKLTKINPHVITRAKKRFSQRVNIALAENNAEFALEIYQDTLELPQTETEIDLHIQGMLQTPS